MSLSSSEISIQKLLKGRNLYLIGMMGCGKTTTGQPLAKKIGYSFVDADSVLEKLVGKSIQEIFEDDGEENFRILEGQVISSIGQHHSLVVATGGGVVTRSENWGILHQGIVLWLDTDRKKLLSRLELDSPKRPLLNVRSLEPEFDEILNSRKRLYSEADLRIVIKDETPDDVVEKIIIALSSLFTDPQDPSAQQTIAT